uniref:E3 ubiquitin-protein ligase ring1 n=1 Tax=Triatoma infestans TaxID=30076 RepID=A0A161TEN8_TRIIF
MLNGVYNKNNYASYNFTFAKLHVTLISGWVCNAG